MTDAGKISAIGYCFGGGVVLHMARMGVDLDAVVSFHGSLGTQMPAEAGKVTAKVLVCNGADDGFVTAEQIEAFKQEMEAAGVDYIFKSYPGAKHSFTNPDADKFAAKFNMPLAYNKAADEQSWQDMKDMFNKIYK
jgi:dienelactone hydrolase